MTVASAPAQNRLLGIALRIGATTCFAGMAAAIKLDSPGPALFPQQRVGKGGRRFRLLKFRTMVADAETMATPLIGRSRDPHRGCQGSTRAHAGTGWAGRRQAAAHAEHPSEPLADVPNGRVPRRAS